MLATSLALVASQPRGDAATALIVILGALCAGLAFLTVYFFPTLLARYRRHHNTVAIFLLNLLLGWSVVGWIVSLVWASTVVERYR